MLKLSFYHPFKKSNRSHSTNLQRNPVFCGCFNSQHIVNLWLLVRCYGFKYFYVPRDFSFSIEMSTLLLYCEQREVSGCAFVLHLWLLARRMWVGRPEWQEQQHTLWFALGQLPDVLHNIIMSGSEKGCSSKHTVISSTFQQMQLSSVIISYYFNYFH